MKRCQEADRGKYAYSYGSRSVDHQVAVFNKTNSVPGYTQHIYVGNRHGDRTERRREVTAKGETVQALRHPELKALLENYPVSFEDVSGGGATYDSAETDRMIAAAKSLAETLASGFVKAHFGQEYDIDLRIVENILGASMEFRLQRDGQVIADFPGYEEAEEPDRRKIINSMDMSFLCKWDAAGASGQYGVTKEVTDPKRMEEYVVGYMLEDFYGRYGKIKTQKY